MSTGPYGPSALHPGESPTLAFRKPYSSTRLYPLSKQDSCCELLERARFFKERKKSPTASWCALLFRNTVVSIIFFPVLGLIFSPPDVLHNRHRSLGTLWIPCSNIETVYSAIICSEFHICAHSFCLESRLGIKQNSIFHAVQSVHGHQKIQANGIRSIYEDPRKANHVN